MERGEEGLESTEIGVHPWRNGVVRVRDLNWDKGNWRKVEVADILERWESVRIRKRRLF